MPVRCFPAEHGANSIQPEHYPPIATPRSLLLSASYRDGRRCKEIFQSSFSSDATENKIIRGSDNGFVRAALEAYNQHRHLVIRPDDVWITILTQLSLYVNANAEELRKLFVSHEGQRELTVHAHGNRYTVDFGDLAVQMTGQLEENINDPSLRAWIMQDFSTTTDNDRVVMAISMMATLQKYFTYKMVLACGIPSVTLLGERQDWVRLLDSLERLRTFGEETAEWEQLLRAVLSRFVATFDAPESAEVKEFWQKIAHHSGGGSGPRYLSGWITAFCFWDDRGECIRRNLTGTSQLRIEGQVFHTVQDTDIAPATVSVPVTLDDNGTVFKTSMVAGCVGIRISSGSDNRAERPLDTLQPQIGWWMFDTISDDEEVSNTSDPPKARPVQLNRNPLAWIRGRRTARGVTNFTERSERERALGPQQ